MSQDGARPKLDIPKQDLGSLSFCDTSLKKFSRWLDRISPFNLVASSHAIADALNEVSRLNIDEIIRLKMLGLLNRHVMHFTQLLSKHYLNKPLVLQNIEKEKANMAQNLDCQIALAYKVVALGMLSNLKKDQHFNYLGVALERVLHYYSQNMLRCYQLYVSIPKSLWQETHAIYQIAETQGLLDRHLSCEFHEEISFSTVDTLYKQILCLSISGPNQLKQRDIGALYKAYACWVRWINIDTAPGEGQHYIIHLNQDQPPNYEQRAQGNSPSKISDTRYLMTNALVGQIQNYLKQQKAVASKERLVVQVDGFNRSGLSVDLLSRLHIILSRPPSRSHDRSNVVATLMLACGYASAHQVAAKPLAYLDRVNGHYEINQATTPESRQTSTPCHLFKVEVINTSDMGYCISFEISERVRVNPGQLVSVFDESRQAWMIGVVSWLEQFKSAGAQMGIQLLAKKVMSCTIQADVDGNKPDPIKAFLIRADIEAGQTAQLDLLCASQALKADTSVSMVCETLNQTLRIKTELSCPGAVRRFRLHEMPEALDEFFD